MRPALSDELRSMLCARLEASAAPGPAVPTPTPSRPQPIHVLYGGAHLFDQGTARKLSRLALGHFEEYGADVAAFARALELDTDIALRIHDRVRHKLATAPIEDLRVDFEDGYGLRSDAEEDDHARRVGTAFAAAMADGALPRAVGIRIKALQRETAGRALRTLDLVVAHLADASGGVMPAGFVVTLPKVTASAQAAALADALDEAEHAVGLAPPSLGMEIMVETPESLVGPDGAWALPGIVAAGRGRVRAAHFGAYDYMSACGITANQQVLVHPACGFARHAMQASCAPLGIWLADGATTVMPVGPHRAPPGASLAPSERLANEGEVHKAWRVHARNVRASLSAGFFQGWDLHPGQLVARYAATYAFFLEGEGAMAERLKAFVDRAAQATRVGTTFDDAATGQGLLNFFARGLASGAFTETDVAARTGLTAAEIDSRSFASIVAARA